MRHISIAMAVVFTSTCISAAPATQGELWETKFTMTSKQHGRMEMPTQTICQKATKTGEMTPEEFMPKEAKRCSKFDMKQSAGLYKWEAVCPEGKTSGQMRIIGNEAYEGEMESNTKDGLYKMEFKGKRLGKSCKLSAND